MIEGPDMIRAPCIEITAGPATGFMRIDWKAAGVLLLRWLVGHGVRFDGVHFLILLNKNYFRLFTASTV